MKISIDATGLSPYKTGTVTYLVEILARFNADMHMSHQLLIFCSSVTRHHFDKLGLDHRFVLMPAPRRKSWQMIWQQTFLPYMLWRHRVDVHWGPGFVLPLLSFCPAVVTIHDMTFDLFPEVHEPIKRLYFPFMIRRSVKRARKVLAISQSTADDLDRIVPGAAPKTVVSLLAARTLGLRQLDGEPDGFAEPSGFSSELSGSYVLFVGTLEPRKNLDRLLQAFKRLPVEIRGDFRLVVVGVKGWMVEKLNADDNEAVDFVGHVSDRELQLYLTHATCFVYPSLYEGFGLPVIEAMAAGIPVLTSDVAATREVAQGAALLVDPLSVDSITDGLCRLLTDHGLRTELSERGLKRAASFDWAQTAKITLETLSAASKSRP